MRFMFIKEALLTTLMGALFAGGVIGITSYLELPILEVRQRPVFLIGIILFALAFRVLISLRQEN